MAQGTSFEVVLKLLMDDKGVRDAALKAKKFSEALAPIEKELKDLEKENKKFSESLAKTFEDLQKGLVTTEDLQKVMNKAVEEGTRQAEKYNAAQAKMNALLAQQRAQAQATKEQIKALNVAQNVLSRRASSAQNIGGKLDQFGNMSSVAGTAIVSGLIAEATAYARRMGDANKETKEFNAQLERMSRARGRVDQVVTRTLLPLLEKAADLVEYAASAVEKNPDIVKFALSAGGILVTLGAIAKLGATGFKLYADATFASAQALGMQAAKLQLEASVNQLTAAGKSSLIPGAVTTGTTTAAGGAAAAGGLSIIQSLGLITIGVIAAGAAVSAVNEVLKAVGVSQKIDAAQQTIRETSRRPYPGVVRPAGDGVGGLASDTDKLGKAAAGAQVPTTRLAQAMTQLKNSAAEAQIVDAYIQMKDELKATETNFQNQRNAIIKASNAEVLASYSNNAKAVSAINQRASSQRDKITSSFLDASKRAEAQYNAERARIVRDGGIEIQRIEEQAQEELRKRKKEFEDESAQLTADRDALGLAKAQQKFDEDQSEIERASNLEISQRRRDIAIRLQDLASSYNAERQQRRAEYLQQLKENEAQRLQELAQQRVQFAEEMKQINDNKNERLRELQQQLIQERQRIREGFIAKVRDLDASLLGEQQKRRQYYALMLRDAEAFLSSYRGTLSKLGSSVGSGAKPYSTGGYAGHGDLIMTHGREFILNNSTTKALETLLGGELDQRSMIRAVSAGLSERNFVWNDKRKFSGEYTQSMRKEVKRDTFSALQEVLNGL